MTPFSRGVPPKARLTTPPRRHRGIVSFCLKRFKFQVTNQNGFTLLELILALAVLSLLLSSIYGLFLNAMRMRERTYARIETGLPKAYIAGILERDLEGMLLPAAEEEPGAEVESTTTIVLEESSNPDTFRGQLLGETDTGGASISDRIEFASAAGAVTDARPWGDIIRVEYYLETPEVSRDDNGLDLVRAITTLPENLMSSSEEPEVQRLLMGVESMTFTYFNDDPEVEDWEDTWDSETEGVLPAAIKVRIEFVAPENGDAAPLPLEVVAETTVKLPESATPEEESA